MNEHLQTIMCSCIKVAEPHGEANTGHRPEDRSSKIERTRWQRDVEFPDHDTVGRH
jgi:hypothetical protein